MKSGVAVASRRGGYPPLGLRTSTSWPRKRGCSVDEVGRGPAHRHVSTPSGHDVAVRQRFSGLVRVDTITTSGERRSPLEAAGDGRGGTPEPGPAAVQLVHRRFADVR
jgi:hypothetical protein